MFIFISSAKIVHYNKLMKPTNLLTEFLNSEKAGGLVLIFCTVISLAVSNSSFAEGYHHLWQTSFAGGNIEYWVNDGLMAIFFLLIGLELKREIYQGRLSNIKDALFPIFGAVGGMLLPAGLFLLFNLNTSTQSGAGIPMATDIAFALGILSLLGNKVPASLKVFLTALAVIDDLGAILVIAIFYTTTLSWLNLGIATGILAALFILNRLKVKNMVPYLLGGIAMWYFMLHSGVHATITGVLLAFALPFENGSETSASYKLQHLLHKPVAFLILPAFALANTAISINSNIGGLLSQPYSLGIIAGLVVGKPLGIFLATFIATKTGVCKLGEGLTWGNIFSVGILAGIGFTMSIFITLLAFNDEVIINNAKLTILTGSLAAALLGLLAVKAALQSSSKIFTQ